MTYLQKKEQEQKAKYNAYFDFAKTQGHDDFKTEELANEYAKLKKGWWGDNMVILEAKKTANGFSPQFNLWN